MHDEGSKSNKNENKDISIESNYYVNEATLELLRRRIESEALQNLVKTIGIPLGSLSVISLLTLWLTIPKTIDSIISSNQFVQSNLRQEVISYFGSKQGQEALNKIVENNVENNVDSFLESEDGKEFLVKAINRALTPAGVRISQRIESHVNHLVSEVELFPDIKSFEKQGDEPLKRILASEDTEKLLANGATIALKFPINQGKGYHATTIRSYILGFKDKFGDRFQSVLVVDGNDQSFIASIPPQLLLDLNDGIRGPQFANLLNNIKDARSLAQDLVNFFNDPSIAKYARSDWTVREALTQPIWPDYSNLTGKVSVINKESIYLGTTTRGQLISGVIKTGNP